MHSTITNRKYNEEYLIHVGLMPLEYLVFDRRMYIIICSKAGFT